MYAALSASVRGFAHGPGDVEDAAWHLLAELAPYLSSPDERAFVGSLLDWLTAERGYVSTPGVAWDNVRAGLGWAGLVCCSGWYVVGCAGVSLCPPLPVLVHSSALSTHPLLPPPTPSYSYGM